MSVIRISYTTNHTNVSISLLNASNIRFSNTSKQKIFKIVVLNNDTVAIYKLTKSGCVLQMRIDPSVM